MTPSFPPCDPPAHADATAVESAAPPSPVAPAVELPLARRIAEPFPFLIRLRQLYPRPLVTPLLVAITVNLFACLVIDSHRWLELDTDFLLEWGAAYGPLALGSEPWRIPASIFLHAGLAHLVINLCFLLLAGWMAERMLGSIAFLGVYLFAGIGGAILSLGWFPTAVQVGASGAVFGVYGALLGCCLRGLRVIPPQVLCRHLAMLLLLTGFMLLDEYMMLRQSLIAHLGGALCGLAAGLVLGPSCRLRGRGWPVVRLAVFLVLAVAAVMGLDRLAQQGAQRALERTAPLADALRHERMLLARYENAMDRWSDGELTDRQLHDLFVRDLIPGWQNMRERCRLQIPDEQQLVQQNMTLMGELRKLDVPRSKRGEVKKPATPELVAEMFRAYSRARLEVWQTWALNLKNETISFNAIMDMVIIELLRMQIDEMVNEDNPLHEWVEFSRTRIREKKLERTRGLGGR